MKLLRPDNKQPAEYVTFSRGYVCLRILDTITPAVRWFSHEQMMAANPMVDLAPARIEHVIPDTDWPVEAYVPRKPLVVTMPAELMIHVRNALYCNIKAA